MEAINEQEAVLNMLSGGVVDLIKRPFSKAFANERLTVSAEQYAVLACLVKENMVTQQTICDRINRDKPNVTRLIDRLETKKLVHRLNDANDRRKKRICITPQGLMVHHRMNDIANTMVNHAVQDIDEGKLAVFRDVLRRMVTNLSAVV